MKIKVLSLAVALTAPLALTATDYLSATFTNGLPKNSTVERIDAGALDAAAYKSITDQGWLTASGLALCPTRNDDGTMRASRLILPAIEIKDAAAIVRWDARSMVAQLPESYKVLVRANGEDAWTELEFIEKENYLMTTRYAALSQYVGKTVEIAFESATPGNSFMIALDNVVIGVPQDSKFAFASTARHYYGDGESVTLGGVLVNFGAPTKWTSYRLEDINGTLIEEIPAETLATLEETQLEFAYPMSVGDGIDYNIVAVAADGKRQVLCTEYVVYSHYRRTLLADRFTGTWCNNCPEMTPTVEGYKVRFGDEAVFTEVHLNDVLENNDYVQGYGSEYVFSIPALIANHNPATIDYKVLDEELGLETFALVSTNATRTKSGNVRFSTEAEMCKDLDNSNGQYTLGYMLLADLHDPSMGAWKQSNSATSGTNEFAYMPSPISRDVTYFDGVVVEASCALWGVSGSLDQQILAGKKMSHNHTLTIPADFTNFDLTAVAMVIDTTTGCVLNCAAVKLPIETPSGIEGIECDTETGDSRIFDLKGRLVQGQPAPGIYVQRGKKILVK